MSLQSVIHVENLLFRLHSRHFLVEKMIKNAYDECSTCSIQ
jgi:hypothetical protein